MSRFFGSYVRPVWVDHVVVFPLIPVCSAGIEIDRGPWRSGHGRWPPLRMRPLFTSPRRLIAAQRVRGH
jgi:hypothetical protein